MRGLTGRGCVLLCFWCVGCDCASDADPTYAVDAGERDASDADAGEPGDAAEPDASSCSPVTGEGCACDEAGAARACSTGTSGRCEVGAQQCVDGEDGPRWGRCQPAPTD